MWGLLSVNVLHFPNTGRRSISSSLSQLLNLYWATSWGHVTTACSCLPAQLVCQPKEVFFLWRCVCVCGNTIGFTDLLFSSLIFFGVVIFYLSLAQPHSVIFCISSMSCPKKFPGDTSFSKTRPSHVAFLRGDGSRKQFNFIQSFQRQRYFWCSLVSESLLNRMM